MPVLNSIAVALPLGYGIGRIGCHLSGDGDYGLPTDGWWGVDYSSGIVPPSVAFRGTSIAAEYPGGIMPDTVLCHPTPLYELFLSVGIFALLFYLIWKEQPTGLIPALYLFLAGMERFFIEFIRINHPVLFGLTQAQWISLLFILAGMIWLVVIYRKTERLSMNTSNSIC
jgi:phosphatidylglycerol---prolipoprotein diacylglyceryl transferase